MAESSAAVGASFLAAAQARAGQKRPSQRHSCTIAQTLRGAALAAARRAARAGRRSAELQAHPPSHSASAVARGADLAALCAPTAGVERRPRTATAAARRDAPGVLRTTREMVDIEIPAQTQERAVRVGLSEARKGPDDLGSASYSECRCDNGCRVSRKNSPFFFRITFVIRPPQIASSSFAPSIACSASSGIHSDSHSESTHAFAPPRGVASRRFRQPY